MADELSELSGCSTALVISEAEDVTKNTEKIIIELLKTHDSGIFITVNQPYVVLKKILEKNNVDTSKLYFIDCISKGAGGAPERSDHCLYISSPSNLTELSIGAMQAIESLSGENKFVFIDSLGTFLIYNSTGSISKFSHFMLTKLSLIGVDAIIMSIEKEMDEKLIAELKSFCEKTLRLK